jgi:hypothetical protein
VVPAPPVGEVVPALLPPELFAPLPLEPPALAPPVPGFGVSVSEQPAATATVVAAKRTRVTDALLRALGALFGRTTSEADGARVNV